MAKYSRAVILLLHFHKTLALNRSYGALRLRGLAPSHGLAVVNPHESGTDGRVSSTSLPCSSSAYDILTAPS